MKEMEVLSLPVEWMLEEHKGKWGRGVRGKKAGVEQRFTETHGQEASPRWEWGGVPREMIRTRVGC